MNYRLLKGCLCWFWNRDEKNKTVGIFVDSYICQDSTTFFYELGGGVYLNCEPAEYKDIMFYNENPMKQGYLTAKEKAERGILEAVDMFLQEEKQQYIDESPNYEIAMENDNIHKVCGESEEVCEAIRKYMELL